jgi:hypothetical protein
MASAVTSVMLCAACTASVCIVVMIVGNYLVASSDIEDAVSVQCEGDLYFWLTLLGPLNTCVIQSVIRDRTCVSAAHM